MTKSALIDLVAKKTGLKKKDAEAALETAFDCIIDTLASGEKVAIAGLGTFNVKERGERNGRNPYTGEAMMLSPSRHISFTVGKTLKEKM